MNDRLRCDRLCDAGTWQLANPLNADAQLCTQYHDLIILHVSDSRKSQNTAPAAWTTSAAMEGRHELVVVRHKSALFTAELKPLIEFTEIGNAEQQEVGEAELRHALRKHARKRPQDRRQQVHEDGIAATLYSPEYFGLQLPVGQRAKDRLNAARIAHYCMC